MRVRVSSLLAVCTVRTLVLALSQPGSTATRLPRVSIFVSRVSSPASSRPPVDHSRKLGIF